MATGQKRKAEEQLTPNSVPVIQPVVARAVPHIPRQPTFMERMRQKIGSAVAWAAAPIIAISSTIYTTLIHRNVEIAAETHIQQALPREDGTTSIKRRKTKRATKRSQLEHVSKSEPHRTKPISSTHPLNAHRKGGRGIVDYTGCVTQRDKEQRFELFWLPPEFAGVSKENLPSDNDGQRSPVDQATIPAVVEKEDVIMTDAEEHEEDILNIFEDQIDNLRDEEGLLSSSTRPRESQVEARTEIVTDVKAASTEPASIPLQPEGSVQRKFDDGSRMTINETTGGLGRFLPRGGARKTAAIGRIRGLRPGELNSKNGAANTLPHTTWSTSIWDRPALEMKTTMRKLSLEDHMVIQEDQITTRSEVEQEGAFTLKLESKDELDVDTPSPKHTPKHGVIDTPKGILKNGDSKDSKNYGWQVKRVTTLTPATQKMRQREAKARAREEAEKKAAAEARLKARLYRRRPKQDLVQPLNSKWNAAVNSIHTNAHISTTSVGGTPIAFKDFHTLLGNHAWLNDEIINAYIEWVAEAANKEAQAQAKAAGEKPSTVPKFIAHNSFFYENLMKKGPQSTQRLMNRKKAGGLLLMQVDSVFVPICRGNHWTIGVVRPCAKTIEYFDSMGGSPRLFMDHMRKWLEFQLGDAYVAEEWKEPKTRCAIQNNGYDCGVFVCTNAFCVAAGYDTSCYQERHMTQQRMNIAAILLNRGFVGDFAWGRQGL